MQYDDTPKDVVITWSFSSFTRLVNGKPATPWLDGLQRPFEYIELPTPTGQHYGPQIAKLGKHPLMTLLEQRGITNPRRVMICGFSQSCQGVLAFLASEDAALIEHAIMIDGIHCGWDNSKGGKPNAARDNIGPSCLGVVIGYSDWASRGPVSVDGLPAARRYCTITHSSIVPTYPSTTETARGVLNKLFGSGWPKTAVPEEISSIPGFKAAYGQHGLVVAGWTGNDAAAHIAQSRQVFQQVVRTILVPRWNSEDPNVPGCEVQTTYGETYQGASAAPEQCDPNAPLVIPTEPIDGSVPWQKYYDPATVKRETPSGSTAFWVVGGIVAVAVGIFVGTLMINKRQKNPTKGKAESAYQYVIRFYQNRQHEWEFPTVRPFNFPDSYYFYLEDGDHKLLSDGPFETRGGAEKHAKKATKRAEAALSRTKNPAELSVRQRAAERANGAQWFNSLRVENKWELGDQLVLGDFDWRDWFDKKPSSAFMNGVDEARMNWEI